MRSHSMEIFDIFHDFGYFSRGKNGIIMGEVQ